MTVNKIQELIKQLENDELEGLYGENNELFIQLFAAYLYVEDLSNARYLWKRIPQNIKNDNNELTKLYEVYLALWSNNTEAFFQNIKYPWSKNIEVIMKELEGKIREETLDLIGQAYTSIFENVLIEKADIPSEKIKEICESLNWKIEEINNSRLIIPKRKIQEKPINTSSEDQLLVLTDFISFLEN